MRFFLGSIFLSFFFCFNSFGQNELWSLERCIKHLELNNLELKISSLQFDKTKIINDNSKYNYFPILNGNANHGYNWGQSIDPFTNKFATNQVRTNSFNIASNLLLFTGLQRYNLRRVLNSDYLMEFYNLEIAKRNLKINLTAFYLQALLNFKSLELFKNQLVVLEKQRERVKSFVSYGKLTEFDLLEIENQIHIEKMHITKKESDFNLSIIDLNEILNLPLETKLKIDTAFTDVVTVNNFEIDNLAELKYKEEEYKKAIFILKQFKGKIYPSLSMISVVGTGYSGNNKELINGQMVTKHFNTQLNDNFYQSLGFNLSIPLFNKLSMHKDVQLAEIDIEKRKFEIENVQQELKSKILKIQEEIKVLEMSQNQLNSSLEMFTKSFNITSSKYELGVINIYNYLDSKAKLEQLEIELVQNKFETIFKRKILSFYTE